MPKATKPNTTPPPPLSGTDALAQMDAAGDRPASAREWADCKFPAMKFDIPTEAKFLADAKTAAAMLPYLRAVLACDDRKLELAARNAPEAYLELLEWFDATANSYKKNAGALDRAALRLGVALTRLELEARP